MDWLLEAVALAALVSMYALAVGSWTELPEVVPTHFGISGGPNAWGSKQTIWLLPALGVLIYALLTVSARYTKFVNLPFPVDRNAPEVQRILARMMIAMKAVTMLLFAYIVWGQIRSAMSQANGLGLALLPVFLVGTLLPMLVYLRQLRRYRK